MIVQPVSYLEVLKWSDEQCRDFLESMRWPDGPVCPKCGAGEPYTITRKTANKNAVRSLYKCRECKKQFTATVGTIFEDSKIPLSKWFAAIYQMCASKKGVSAHQIHREMGVTYKSAWFMCHRIREAMRDKHPTLFSGTVEADETYVGGKERGHWTWKERRADEVQMGLRKKPDWREKKAVVFGMGERGGRVRTMVVDKASANILEPLITGNVDTGDTHLMTDGHAAYRLIRNHLPHAVINHEETYVDGDTHTQSIEGYWSILKRGLIGTFHHVDAQYLPNYLNEFEYRYNSRKVKDELRFVGLLGQVQGRVEWFCQTEQAENPYA